MSVWKIFVLLPGGQLFELEDKWEEREDEENDSYYDALVNDFGDGCVCV